MDVTGADIAGRAAAAREHQRTELDLLRSSILPPDEELELLDDGDLWHDTLDQDPGSHSPRNTTGSASEDTGPDARYTPEVAGHVVDDSARVRHDHDSGNDSDERDSDRSDRGTHFAVRVKGAPVFFEVVFPQSYAGLHSGGRPSVRARGVDAPLGKANAALWETILQEKQELVIADGAEYPIFELFSMHLLPFMHDSPTGDHQVGSRSASPAPSAHSTSSAVAAEKYHALMTSHHLKSPSKRRSLSAWSAEHGLAGFAKLGHPGVIYLSGPQAGVERFVRDVKAMQWLALRVRFIEQLPGEMEAHEWTELEKVGEVVDWMRHRSREAYVVEMGIGSAGSK